MSGAEPPPRRLVVYVHGLGSGRSAESFVARIRDELGPDDTVRLWRPKLHPFSHARLADRAHQLRVQLRVWATEPGDVDTVAYDSITLVGHSIGGLIVRHAYLLDMAAYGDESVPQEWAMRVDRIVLLASPNRGFEPASLPFIARIGFRVLAPLAVWTVEDAQAGSPYVTELRLRWMRHFDRVSPVGTDAAQGESGRAVPTVVQVLGDRDDLVTKDDSVDVEQFPTASHLYVPNATHSGLPDVDHAPDPDERWLLLREALFDELDSTDPATTLTSSTVVFLLHGIRANKDTWVRDLESVLADRRSDVVTYGPSYGYFSAASFAIPWTRKRNLRAFLDAYSRLYAQHRGEGSHFHFIGHSNGTYILGQALRAVPAVRFERVYLAGSVLPRTYQLESVFDRKQVQQVRNDCADHDVPVMWLCSALRGLGMRDLGTAGVDGFYFGDRAHLRERAWFHGNHGTCLESTRHQSIAGYVLDGTDDVHLDGKRPKLFATVGRSLGVLAPLLAAAAAVAVGYWVSLQDSLQRGLLVAGVGLVLFATLKAA